jgi:hypothetical protein
VANGRHSVGDVYPDYNQIKDAKHLPPRQGPSEYLRLRLIQLNSTTDASVYVSTCCL